MSSIRKAMLTLATLVVISFAAPAVNADVVAIGGTSGPPNAFPFGAINYLGAYQQVYAGSAFTSGPVTITQIAFAASIPTTAVTRTLNLSLGLSTTSRAPGGLLPNYAANRGPDFTNVFSGSQTFTTTPTVGDFDLVFNITPFTYNPGSGNLLLDVFINSSSGPNIFFIAGTDDPRSSRVFNLGGSGVPTVDNISLRTQITFTPGGGAPIPEPVSLLLLGTGLAGVGAAVRKRRQVNREGD